jgi:hypothetical protein
MEFVCCLNNATEFSIVFSFRYFKHSVVAGIVPKTNTILKANTTNSQKPGIKIHVSEFGI